ncbi:MAG: hypothetical protein HUU47_04040 [Bacteroidetes bacterium]|nr:hypothetical protein [Bacteroidota bacterium]
MLINKSVITFFLFFLTTFCYSQQKKVNKFRIYLGAGDRNPISDYISLTDKSFNGEVSWQYRAGLRLVDNYELNFATYYRKIMHLQSDMSYNKLSGYSAAFGYEFRKPKSRVGYPLALEVMKFTNNLDSSFSDGRKPYTDNYSSMSYGFKIGLRYHFSRFVFMETEANFMYEKFNLKTDWGKFQRTLSSNNLTSFKFLGISLNISI